MPNLHSVKIAYWNCRGAMGKKGDIEKLASTLDILFLAETCVGAAQEFRLRGFDCLRVDSNWANIRGMMVLIRNPITYSSINLSSILDDSFEALGIVLTLNNPPHSSTLDLAIASPRISPLCNTLILPYLLGSDHFPIMVQVNYLVRTSTVFSYKVTLSKAQRDDMELYLHNNANSISQAVRDINPDDPVSQYNTFMNLISASYERFSPSKPPPSTKTSRASFTKKGPPPTPWWTPDCTTAVRRRSNALKTYKQSPTWDNYINIKIFYFSKFDHNKSMRHLNKSFCKAPRVPEILKNHSFTIKDSKTLIIKRYSNAATCVEFTI
ncbi:hypothetical protein ALC57_15424 [Trachymyrmex cornetzi]|uniref:Endonuclease/exonuclease/phosphatase domain-containing protein n=1 Tax=Trachymyrmex cornetzi TaxID=471704 RepID=A0A151IX46_9HYME|nr:hypothetical protein ALC57_15424 [Trachymyrmex cornetzi]